MNIPQHHSSGKREMGKKWTGKRKVRHEGRGCAKMTFLCRSGILIQSLQNLIFEIDPPWDRGWQR